MCACTAHPALPERPRRLRWKPAQPRCRLPRECHHQAARHSALAPQHRALELWDLSSQLGTEPHSPELQGGFSSTGPASPCPATQDVSRGPHRDDPEEGWAGTILGHTTAFERADCPVAGQLASGRVRQPRVVRGVPRRSEESLSRNGTDQEDPLISQDQASQHTAAPRSQTAKMIALI